MRTKSVRKFLINLLNQFIIITILYLILRNFPRKDVTWQLKKKWWQEKWTFIDCEIGANHEGNLIMQKTS